MSKKTKISGSQALKNLATKLAKLKKFLWLFLLIFFVVIYGYVVIKLDGFVGEQPSSNAISNDLKTAAQPAINPKVVNQLNQLQNNSISVQALFDQGRSNPFQ